jgi:hypothetical protein
MIFIKEAQELRVNNVLSVRKKITQQQIQDEMQKIGQDMVRVGAKKVGKITTATFGMEVQDNNQIIDMEILIPVDQAVLISDLYKVKTEFHLVNALYTRYTRYQGHPANIQSSILEL